MRRNTARRTWAVAAGICLLAACVDDELTGPRGPSTLAPAFLVTGPTASLSGTTGAVIDPGASSALLRLRYTGNPAPAGYSHDYQWGSPAVLVRSPEAGSIAMEGTLDVSDVAVGDVSMIGFLDAAALASGEHAFQTGAYVYVHHGASGWRIGVSDGNAGGEIVQTFHTIPDGEMPADGVLDFTFTVDGTADPSTCAVGAGPTGDGCMYLDLGGTTGPVLAQLKDSYGALTATGSASPEFSGGAVPGWDDYIAAGVHYDVVVGPIEEPPVVSDVLATPNPVSVSQAFTLTAKVDDSGTGGADIASAEYSLDGGATWQAMAASDGAFDEPAEDVTANVTHTLEPGLHEVCVRGTDAYGATSAGVCTTLVVYDPSGGFVTGGGWIDSPGGAFLPSSETVVTAANLGVDWLLTLRAGSAGEFVNGPDTPPLGSGSFSMSLSDGVGKVTLFNYDHIGTRLADIESIMYATYRASGSTNPAAQYPGLNIEVDWVGDGSTFTTLVWEPLYSYGQSALLTDVWQTWDAMAASATSFAGGWWSTRDIPGVCAFNCFVSWEDIVAANPEARIKFGFGVNIGSGWNGAFSGAVDALSLETGAGTTTYDFEVTGALNPTGKATFGFVAKYKKGANAPDGTTQFSFQAAELNFHSSSYDWLVVNQGGENAQFKGTGTITGMPGEYQFMLWAGDHDDGDTFRIRIWEKDNESNLIYDNGAAQTIGGGNIIVHTGKK